MRPTKRVLVTRVAIYVQYGARVLPALDQRRSYLAIALAVRELVRERLADEEAPRLTALTPDIVLFATAVVEGAAAARGSAR